MTPTGRDHRIFGIDIHDASRHQQPGRKMRLRRFSGIDIEGACAPPTTGKKMRLRRFSGITDSEWLRNSLRLYVVTDERQDAGSLEDVLAEAIAGGATAVQLRRKGELGRRFVEMGRAVKRITAGAGVLFIVNDRVDVALLVDADGVHVGQDDIDCSDARRLLRHRIVGVSAATVQEALAAERAGADYLGVGAVFPTRSKPDADASSLHELSQIAKAVKIPVVGIGGIGQENAASVLAAGADGVAVVSAVMSAANPRAASQALLRCVGRSLQSRAEKGSPDA
ncbi:MAG: thiamine phosphate synthase, partial [Bacilli bacterium]